MKNWKHLCVCLVTLCLTSTAYADVAVTSSARGRESLVNQAFFEADNILLVKNAKMAKDHVTVTVVEVLKNPVLKDQHIQILIPEVTITSEKYYDPRIVVLNLENNQEYLLFLKASEGKYILLRNSLFDGYLVGKPSDFDLLPYGGAVITTPNQSASINQVRLLLKLNSADEAARELAIISLFTTGPIKEAYVELDHLHDPDLISNILLAAVRSGNFLDERDTQFIHVAAARGGRPMMEWAEKAFGEYHLQVDKNHGCDVRQVNLALLVASFPESAKRSQAARLIWDNSTTCVNYPIAPQELGRLAIPEIDSEAIKKLDEAITKAEASGKQANSKDLTDGIMYFTSAPQLPSALTRLLIRALDISSNYVYDYCDTIKLLKRIVEPTFNRNESCAWTEIETWKEWWKQKQAH